MKTYSNYLSDIPRIIGNSQSDNLAWAMDLIQQSIRYLVTKYYFNERSYSVPGGTVAQTQFYNLPPQVKKIINVTVTVGTVLWQPKECPSRAYWDSLNVVTFYQDFPSFFFIYNGQVGIWPIPSSAGNAITLNYKTRLEDLSMADVASGSVTITSGSTVITGTGTSFVNWMSQQGWLRIPHSSTNISNGDNQWYEISSVSGTTTLILKNAYGGSTVTNGSVTIGEVPILPEDYQDLPLYRMGVIYYTTRFPDPTKAQMYQSLWNDGVKALDDEFGSKTTNVVVADTEAPVINPNLFQRSVS